MKDIDRRELELFAAGFVAGQGLAGVPHSYFTNEDIALMVVEPETVYTAWSLDRDLVLQHALLDKLRDVSKRVRSLQKVESVKFALNKLELGARGTPETFEELADGFVASVQSIFAESSDS